MNDYHFSFSEKILRGDENAARLIGTPLETRCVTASRLTELTLTPTCVMYIKQLFLL